MGPRTSQAKIPVLAPRGGGHWYPPLPSHPCLPLYTNCHLFGGAPIFWGTNFKINFFISQNAVVGVNPSHFLSPFSLDKGLQKFFRKVILQEISKRTSWSGQKDKHKAGLPTHPLTGNRGEGRCSEEEPTLSRMGVEWTPPHKPALQRYNNKKPYNSYNWHLLLGAGISFCCFHFGISTLACVPTSHPNPWSNPATDLTSQGVSSRGTLPLII